MIKLMSRFRVVVVYAGTVRAASASFVTRNGLQSLGGLLRRSALRDIATSNGLYVRGDDPPGALPIIGKPSQNAPCAQLEVREQLSVSS